MCRLRGIRFCTLYHISKQSCFNKTQISRIIYIYITSYLSGALYYLTHWGRVTHICIRKITIIGSDNGLSPGRCQAIIWSSVAILLIGPLGTNFSEILIDIYIFSFKKMDLKMSSGKWRPFCLGLNVLKLYIISTNWSCCPWHLRTISSKMTDDSAHISQPSRLHQRRMTASPETLSLGWRWLDKEHRKCHY